MLYCDCVSFCKCFIAIVLFCKCFITIVCHSVNVFLRLSQGKFDHIYKSQGISETSNATTEAWNRVCQLSIAEPSGTNRPAEPGDIELYKLCWLYRDLGTGILYLLGPLGRHSRSIKCHPLHPGLRNVKEGVLSYTLLVKEGVLSYTLLVKEGVLSYTLLVNIYICIAHVV